MANNAYNQWLDTFVSEKQLDTDHIFSCPGLLGENMIPLGVVLEHIKIAPRHEQQAIKTMIVKIDFANGDVMDYFNHLAKALAL